MFRKFRYLKSNKRKQPSLMSKSKTFLEALQMDKELDLRDNRGKVHDIGIILVEFVLALLCHRDGNLSAIWRHMKSHHSILLAELGLLGDVPKKRYRDRICHLY